MYRKIYKSFSKGIFLNVIVKRILNMSYVGLFGFFGLFVLAILWFELRALLVPDRGSTT
jgi:hypothetical protein